MTNLKGTTQFLQIQPRAEGGSFVVDGFVRPPIGETPGMIRLKVYELSEGRTGRIYLQFESELDPKPPNPASDAADDPIANS